MSNIKNRFISIGIAALTAAMFVFYGFSARPKNALLIHFDHVVDQLPLKLDSVTYTNSLGQPYTISKFKYYISGISLKSKGGKEIHYPGSYLVNEEEPDSKNIHLNGVRMDEYVSLSFIVGVDSAHNCSGAQSGDLDPVKGMFWAWNTGYVFLKLEGHSPVSNSPGHILEYHVGGYKKPTNCIRTVTIDLKDHAISTDPAGLASLNIRVNAAQLLKDPFTIDFSKLSSVTDAVNAPVIADNYADMFSLGLP